MKGEERVCHVTEADAPGAKLVPAKAGGAGCIREVSSCEAAWAWGVLPLCAAVCAAERKFRRGSSASKGIWWMPWH